MAPSRLEQDRASQPATAVAVLSWRAGNGIATPGRTKGSGSLWEQQRGLVLGKGMERWSLRAWEPASPRGRAEGLLEAEQRPWLTNRTKDTSSPCGCRAGERTLLLNGTARVPLSGQLPAHGNY